MYGNTFVVFFNPNPILTLHRTILMVEPRAPSPSRPSFLSIFLHLLTRPFTLLSTLLQHLFANRLFAPASPRVEFADDDLDALD